MRNLRRLKEWVINKVNPPRQLPSAPRDIVKENDFTPSKYVGHYYGLWDTVQIRDKYLNTIEATYNTLKRDKWRYQRVSNETGVPWIVVAIIHLLEGGRDFNTVLHNGESLSNVNKYGTRLVPKGYGKGMDWNWGDAAIHALSIKSHPEKWTVINTLYFLERYNGLGYLRSSSKPNSPYIWSFTNHYTKGKYVADGKYSSTAVSKQIGAAGLLLFAMKDGEWV